MISKSTAKIPPSIAIVTLTLSALCFGISLRFASCVLFGAGVPLSFHTCFPRRPPGLPVFLPRRPLFGSQTSARTARTITFDSVRR
jgi:hypothetical protein